MVKNFKIALFLIVLLATFAFCNIVLASETNGTVTGSAWSSNAGWIDFGAATGNIYITDSNVTGYAWSSNLGWINMDPTLSGVTNDSEGNLSGYAWCENSGWIDFSGVTIGSTGVFSGNAVGDNIGTINFSCNNCDVVTDWRPASSRVSAPVCPDGTCNGLETCSSCSSDCGSCSGGGGANYFWQSIFSGIGYPDSTIIFLKDSQIVGTTIADKLGNFSLNISGSSLGSYSFGIYGKDQKGANSALVSRPVTVNFSSIANISDILIPPTIYSDKSSVKKGDKITFFGYGAKNSEIVIYIESNDKNLSLNTNSDENGFYSYDLQTSGLKEAIYSVKAKFILNKKESSFGKQIDFEVGGENIFSKPLVCPDSGDMNSDCKVNLIDFSILIYWFDRENVPARIDLNNDKTADLIDFSIMAYNWTG